MTKLIYLASPYSHPDKEVMEHRFQEAIRAGARLMNLGVFVYSPIIHNHPIAMKEGLQTGWDFWMKHDLLVLDRCDEVAVLMLDGWRDSVGVRAELEYAKSKGMKVNYLSVENWQGEA